MRSSSFRAVILVGIVALQFSPPVHAESTWKTLSQDLATPWTTRARPWLIGGAGATGLVLALDYEVNDRLQDSWSTRKPLGDWAELGDYGGQMISNGVYTLSMLSTYWITDNPMYREFAIVMFKGSMYAVSVNYLLKILVHEQRPNKGDYLSFPSGHAAAAFSFAGVVWAQHGWLYGLPATALAILTGASRINSNHHYLHDVLGGATVGLSYALGISYLRKGNEPTQSSWQIYPILSRDLVMIGFNADWDL